ncbi:YuiA family protein [Bacillus subtilis]
MKKCPKCKGKKYFTQIVNGFTLSMKCSNCNGKGEVR